MDLDPTSEDMGASHEGGGAPPRACPLPRGAPVAPLTCFFCLYNSIYPKTSRTHNRLGVPPPEASVATKNQSRPIPAPCQRGQSFPGGHLHHPGALHDKEGVVHPRGWGYVPVAFCLISLSLARARSWFTWSWCITGFVNIVRSYGVFPSLSCDESSFPFGI